MISTLNDAVPGDYPRPTPEPGAPNVVVIVLDDVGLRAARLLRLRHRHPAHRPPRRGGPPLQPLPRHRLCSPTRALPADRPQPPRRRHGLPHRHPDGVPRVHRPHPEVGDAAPAAPARRRATTRSRSASGTSCPAASARTPVRSTAGRSATASSATTGSSRATPTSGRRTSCATTTTSIRPASPRGRLSPQRGSRRRGDPLRHTSSSRPPRPPVLPLRSRSGPCTRHITWPPSGSSPTAVSSTAVGNAGASEIFARQVELGIVPPETDAQRTPELDPGLGAAARARRPADAGPPAGGVRRVPLAHRRADRRRARRSSSDLGCARRHDRDADLRQRRERRGRRARHVQRAPVHRARSRDRRGATSRWYDELGGLRTYPHYSWGWAWAGNTPLRLWKRYTWLGGTRTPLIVHWPDGIEAAGRGPQPVRARRRPDADRPRRVRRRPRPTSSTASSQQPVDGATTARHLRRRARARAPLASQYFEMLGSRSIVADGWKATTDHVSKGVADEEAPPRRQPRRSPTTPGRSSASPTTSPRPTISRDRASRRPRPPRGASGPTRPRRNQVFPVVDELVARITAILPPPNPAGDALSCTGPEGGSGPGRLRPPVPRGLHGSPPTS